MRDLDSLHCDLRHQGQIVDEETRLYYNRHRYYDSQICQYLSLDPIGLAGGTRPQAYVHNPLEWEDPFGLSGCPSKNHLDNRKQKVNSANIGDIVRTPSSFPEDFIKMKKYYKNKYTHEIWSKSNSRHSDKVVNGR